MKAVASAFKALLRLFFDDGTFALAIVVLLACTAMVAMLGAVPRSVPLALLICGTVILLFESVIRAARER